MRDHYDKDAAMTTQIAPLSDCSGGGAAADGTVKFARRVRIIATVVVLMALAVLLQSVAH